MFIISPKFCLGLYRLYFYGFCFIFNQTASYIFSKGDGDDTINNFQDGIVIYGSKIKFRDVMPEDLRGIYTSGNDLIIEYGENDRITIKNHCLHEHPDSNRDYPFKITEMILANNVRYSLLTRDIIDEENYDIGRIIFRGNGDDYISGNLGPDIMFGGQGGDSYVVNDPKDAVIELFNEGIDDIRAEVSNYALPDNVENLRLFATTHINGYGNDSDNYIQGNGYRNIIDGRGGIDTMSGGKGEDQYYVDDSSDVVIEGNYSDTDVIYSTADYALSNDTVTGYVENLTLRGNENLSATGNFLNNIITGNYGDNTITGGAGNDLLYGNTGNDTFIYNIGDKSDRIIDTNGINTVRFGLGIDRESLQFVESGDDLIIYVNGQEDMLRIEDWFTYKNIESFEFEDGDTPYSAYDVKLLFNTLPVASLTEAQANEGESETLDVLGQSSDVDGDEVSIQSYTQPENGSVSEQENKLIYISNPGFFGDDNFEYTISDGYETVTQTITVNVNALPVLSLSQAITDEDISKELNVLGQSSDANEDTLVITAYDETSTHGTISLEQNGNLLYTPGTDFNGTDSFEYTISDGNGGEVTQTVNITVNPINDAPTAVLTTAETNENESVQINVLENASDIDGDSFSLVEVKDANGGTVEIENAATGLVRYTPENAFSGEGTFIYIIEDENYAQTEQTVTVNVIPLLPRLIEGTSGNDIAEAAVHGNEADNELYGYEGDDELYGYAGNDSLDGGDGSDTLTGGDGNDVYYVDTLTDRIIENDNEGDDLVIGETNINLLTMDPNNAVENIIIMGTSDFWARGNSLDNIITGNSGNNRIFGGAGNDIYYVDYDDQIYEYDGEGTDTVLTDVNHYRLGYNVDEIYAYIENLTLLGTADIKGSGNALDNIIIGNSGDNYLRGYEGNDTIYGNDGSDSMQGDAGNDSMIGGKGDDFYHFDNPSDVAVEYENEGNDTISANFNYSLEGTNVENLTLYGSSNTTGTGDDNDNYLGSR